MDETREACDARLLQVIAQADTDYLESPFAWRPLGGGAPSDDAIACVRDGDAWFQFVPAAAGDPVGFTTVCFRFAEDGPSAIGFVAWLHAHLRDRGRTGAILICGKDRRDTAALAEICQGAMDYWACPAGPAGDRFLEVIKSLIAEGQAG